MDGELGGGSDIQVCVENHLILTLMSAAPFFLSYDFAALPWLRVPLLAFLLGWFLP